MDARAGRPGGVPVVPRGPGIRPGGRSDACPAARAVVRVRALMYHGLVAEGGPRDGFGRRRCRHVRRRAGALQRASGTHRRGHRRPARERRRADRGSARGGAWMLTFDDGAASALEAAEQLARRYWRGHFFIATDLVGTPGFLTWDGVRELARCGHVVGSHSCSHPDRMAACSPEELLDEWSRSGAMLAEALGRPVSTASVPGGLYSPERRSGGGGGRLQRPVQLAAEPAARTGRRLPDHRPLRDPPRHRRG